MSTLAARIAPAAAHGWFGLVETSLRVLLVVAGPVAAAIFIGQSL